MNGSVAFRKCFLNAAIFCFSRDLKIIVDSVKWHTKLMHSRENLLKLLKYNEMVGNCKKIPRRINENKRKDLLS